MARKGRGRAWIFLVCWIAVTCFALTFPFHLKHPPAVLKRGGDKVIHTVLFAVMGLSAQAAAPWISLLVTGPFAVGLELVQKKLPRRDFDVTDMLANITGIFLGLASYELSRRLG